MSDDDDRSEPSTSRRSLLKYGGSGVLTTVLAGCNELSDQMGDTGTTTGGGDETTRDGTTTPGGGGDERPIYAIDPPQIVEDASNEVRGAFLDARYTELGVPVDGADAATHVVSYGHDASGADGEGPMRPPSLAAGVVTTPKTVADGMENPLATAPIDDLVAGAADGNLLQALGLGTDAEVVAGPRRIASRDAMMLDGSTTAAAYLVAVSVPVGETLEAKSLQAGVGLATVYAARTFVGGNAVICGMLGGWERPPTMTPERFDMTDDTIDLLADIYKDIERMALFVDSLGAMGRLGIDSDDMPPPPEEKYKKVTLSSKRVGLPPQAQTDIGYEDQTTSDVYNFVSYTRGRDSWSIGSRSANKNFDPGTRYEYDIETLSASYPVDGDDTYPVGVLTAPTVERHGEERNPLAYGKPKNIQPLLDVVVDDYGVFDGQPGYVAWTNRPFRRTSASNTQLLGKSASVVVYGGTLARTHNGSKETKDVEFIVARIEDGGEVVVAATLRVETGNAYWDDRSRHVALFEDVLRQMDRDTRTPNDWNDIGFASKDIVQTVANTRAEDGSGSVIDDVDDPPLVVGENVAPIYKLSAKSRVTSDLPDGAVVTVDVENRADLLWTEPSQGDLKDLTSSNWDAPSLFHNLAADTKIGSTPIPANDPVVFELADDHDTVTLRVYSRSGYKWDVTSLTVTNHYEVEKVDPLNVGFITVEDPDNGSNYGDSSGVAPNYEDSVEVALEYLHRTYPGPLNAYRHESSPIGGHTVGVPLITREEFLDFGDARNELERYARESAFPSKGTVWGFGASDAAAERYISGRGFDVWVLVVPRNYYKYHGQKASGLAPARGDRAVSALEFFGGYKPRESASTVAQEVGHHFVDKPYDIPGPNGNYPFAQRDNRGEDKDLTGNLAGDIDRDHARFKGSKLDPESGTDEPGVLSWAFDLTDGQFSHVKDFWFVTTSSGDLTFDVKNSGGMKAGSLPSYMCYKDDAALWTDGVIYDHLMDSGWAGLSHPQAIFAGTGTVADDGTISFASMRTYSAAPRTETVDDGNVLVELLAPDGEVLASRRITDAVEGHHADDYSDIVSFHFEFPQTTSTLRVTHEDHETGETTETTTNPIVGVLRDAVRRVPDEGFTIGPADARGTLQVILDDVATSMSNGDYTGANDHLATFAERVSSLVREDYDAYANEPRRSDLADLTERMQARVEAVGSAASDDSDTGGTADRWTTFQGDAANTGHRADGAGPTASVSERWRVKTAAGSSASATTDGETVYIGDDAGGVYALSASDGSVEWTTEILGAVRSASALAGGTLYVATKQGAIFALDAASGDQRWVVETGESIDNLPAAIPSPTVVDGVVYVATPAGTLYALDAASGDEQWSVDLGAVCEATPAVGDGVVYAADTAGGVVAVDAADGSVVWEATASDGVSAAPTLAHGRVYVGTNGGALEAFDATDGAPGWTFEADVHFFVSSPAATADALFVGSGGSGGTSEIGHIHAVDAADGTERWRVETGDHNLSSPAVIGDTVYAGSGDGFVYALATSDGSERWSFDTGGNEPIFDDVTGSPAVVAGTVYVVASSASGTAHAFAIEGSST